MQVQRVLIGLLAALVLLALAGCQPIQPEAAAGGATNASATLAGELRGTVAYRERMALSAGAVVEVSLLDMGNNLAVLGETAVTTTGEQPPIAFVLTYDPAQIDSKGVYAVAARILIDGAPAFVATEPTPVLTQGAPATDITITLFRNTEGAGAAPVVEPLTFSGTLTKLDRMALPPGTGVVVDLLDTTSWQPIASDTYTTTGEQVPLPFAVQVQPDMMAPEGSYGLVARLLLDGQPRYVTMEPTPVQPGQSAEGIELMLDNNAENLAPQASGATTATTGAAEVTGVLTYRERMALPAGAVITVQLLDIARADAPATVLAEQVITTTGEQVPIAFTLPYDPAQITARGRYTVSARIVLDGKLMWISDTVTPVLGEGQPTSGVEVRLVRVP